MAKAKPIEDEKRAKGFLEAEVQRVTNDFAGRKFKLNEGELLTPHRISKRIADTLEVKRPSPGAIANTLRRWSDIGFAEINDDPLAFISYNQEWKRKGLAACKAAHRDQLKQERDTAKEKAATAAAKKASAPTKKAASKKA